MFRVLRYFAPVLIRYGFSLYENCYKLFNYTYNNSILYIYNTNCLLANTYTFNEKTDLGPYSVISVDIYEYILYFDKDSFSLITSLKYETDIVDINEIVKQRYSIKNPYKNLLSITGIDKDGSYIILNDIINKLFYYNNNLYWNDIFKIINKILNTNLESIHYYIDLDDIDPFDPIIIKKNESHLTKFILS